MKTHLIPLAVLAAIALLPAVASGNPDKTFYSAKPTPRVADWQIRMHEITTELASRNDLGDTKLVFIGDSITHYWLMGDNPWFQGQKGGRAIWDESFGTPGSPNYAINLGVTGDRTEHVLFRIMPKSAGGRGELDNLELQPEFVVILIGINNTWNSENPVPDSVYAGVKAVIAGVKTLKPNAQIVVLSLLPTNDPARNFQIVQAVNTKLAKLAASPKNESLHYLDLYSAYVNKSGAQQPEFFYDGLHLNEAGYRVWRDRLVAFIEKIRATK